MKEYALIAFVVCAVVYGGVTAARCTKDMQRERYAASVKKTDIIQDGKTQRNKRRFSIFPWTKD